MKVAVIVITHNHEKYIRQCLWSILTQTYKKFNIFVYDAHSTDNTLNEINKVIEENNTENYITCLKASYFTEKICPIGINRYKIVETINCYNAYDLIAFIDGDDYWFYNKLEKQVDLFKQNYNIKLVYSNATFKYEELDYDTIKYFPKFIQRKVLKKRHRSFHEKYRRYDNNIFWNLLTKRNFIPLNTIICRVEELKELIEPLAYISAEDYDLVLKFANKYDIGYVDKILAAYRIHNNQVTNNNSVRCSFEEIDCIKRNAKLRDYSSTEKMKIHLHILWIYIKLMIKQYKETEDYVRN